MKKKFKFKKDQDDCEFAYREYDYCEILEITEVSWVCIHKNNKKHECEEEYCPLKSGQ